MECVLLCAEPVSEENPDTATGAVVGPGLTGEAFCHALFYSHTIRVLPLPDCPQSDSVFNVRNLQLHRLNESPPVLAGR